MREIRRKGAHFRERIKTHHDNRRFRNPDRDGSLVGRSAEHFRVGKSRVLLELVLDAFRAARTEAIAQSYRNVALGGCLRGRQPLFGESRPLRRVPALDEEAEDFRQLETAGMTSSMSKEDYSRVHGKE